MMKPLTIVVMFSLSASAWGATLRVPSEFKTIQAAVDAAAAGDVVLVAAGTYRERIQLKQGITLRSEGDDAPGILGLKRAETTILDGGGDPTTVPGVTIADGATLDGFTITRVGTYDEKVWQLHYDTRGETLEDGQGAVQENGAGSAVSVNRVNCTVTNNVVHHNGGVGIAVVGRNDANLTPLITGNVCYRNLGGGIGIADFAAPIVRGNRCFENLREGIGCRNASPLIVGNQCHENIRAGIGCREGATPIVRGNKCFQNRRAGIGIRMNGTAPVVEHNECYENGMAGIGSRDSAEPIVRNNKCFRNEMAGIGSDGSNPVIVANECRENQMAGIGLRGAAKALIHGNRCIENKLVAIGVTQGSVATISSNQLMRTGGVPPLIAVKDDSSATISKNEIRGGGVAGILAQGRVQILGNTFLGQGEKQGNAVWVWEGSVVDVSDNQFTGYRTAVNGSKASLHVTNNNVAGFQSAAIVIRDGTTPTHVFGNKAISADPTAEVVKVTGATGVVADNTVTKQ